MEPSAKSLGNYCLVVMLMAWLFCCCLNHVEAFDENDLEDQSQQNIISDVADVAELMLLPKERKFIDDEANGKHLLIIPWGGVILI